MLSELRVLLRSFVRINESSVRDSPACVAASPRAQLKWYEQVILQTNTERNMWQKPHSQRRCHLIPESSGPPSHRLSIRGSCADPVVWCSNIVHPLDGSSKTSDERPSALA